MKEITMDATDNGPVYRVPLALERAGINGLEGKTDAQHVSDWVKASFTAITEQGAEWLTHLAMRKCVAKFDALKDEATEIVLDEIDLHLIRWALMSSRFPGNSNKMACQILEKFGISL